MDSSSATSSRCGIACAQCALFKMTVENDAAKKQALFEANRPAMREDLGMEAFDPDKMFCHGCEPGDKPLRFGMDRCVIRTCAKGKAVQTCVACRKVGTCDQEAAWRWFSDPRRHRLVFLRAAR